MTTSNVSNTRSVTLERVGLGEFVARSPSGGVCQVGGEGNLTPVELLLAAIAGCSAMDVDYPVTRRAEPERFEVECRGEKIDADGRHRMDDIQLTWRITFPDTPQGQAATALVPRLVSQSHERLCTVSITVATGAKVTNTIA